jgi:predicted dehydrogenase
VTIATVVVGAGRWGLRLIAQLAAHPEIELRAVADPDATARARAASVVPRVEASLGAALACAPDLVVVATPPALHAEHALEALAVADVFVEKPLALRGRDARVIRARARERGRVVCVGHVLRYHPAYEELGRLVASGAIGHLRHFSARRFTQSGTARPLWALAPHDLATLRALDVTPVRRTTLRQDGPTTTFDLRMTSGLTASLELATTASSPLRSVVVHGSDGVLHLDELAGTLARVEPDALHTIATPPLDPLAREIDDLVRAVRARSEPRSDVDTATWIVETLERAERTLARPPVEVEAPAGS